MSDLPRLTPCFIERGTITSHIDMMRVLDTVEGLRYVQTLDGQVISEGRATLVKLAADPHSSTLLVNGCLFLNVSSFRHLTFSTSEDGSCRIDLAAEGMALALYPIDEPRTETSSAVRLLQQAAFEETYVSADDDESDESDAGS
jgi:hypothetical protein